MTNFQKLVYSIAHSLNDDSFLSCIRMLCNYKFVNRESLNIKLQQILNNLKVIETAQDYFTELKAASFLSQIRGVNHLVFSEIPDILINFYNYKITVEVKRFRYRTLQDSEMENKLSSNAGELIEYGNPLEIQTQVDDVIKSKLNSYKGIDPYYLYLWSDSPHIVEDCEIKAAVNFLRRNNSFVFNKMKGIFYKYNGLPLSLIIFENSHINTILKNIFIESKWNVTEK